MQINNLTILNNINRGGVDVSRPKKISVSSLRTEGTGVSV